MMPRNVLAVLASSSLFVLACSGPGSESPFDPSANAAGNSTDPSAAFQAPGAATPSTSVETLAACATQTAAVEAKPLYLVFAYDQSGSMARNNKWENAKAAMKGFFSGPAAAGINASMTLFPAFNNDFCSTTQYLAPQVPVTALPSPAFGAALDATQPDPGGRGTPTVAALGGALAYAKSLRGTTAKDGTVAVVMVTDGIPEACVDNRDISQAVGVAAMNAGTIPTYVVGVGSQLDDLNQLAAGGGTGAAFIVSVTDPSKTQADLAKAFDSIKLSALTCDYKIPSAPAGQSIDPAKVNVQYTAVGAASAALGYNQACAGGTGWRYDDATTPTRIIACEATCSTIKATAGKVDIVFGCATRAAQVN